MKNDLTVIYISANHITDYFAENIRKQILISKGDYDLISVTHKPIDFGKNICVGDIERNKFNIYRQLLIGAKEAKTKYIAIAEDDVLYPPGHFDIFRPDDDKVAYNFNRWSLYTWREEPIFALKSRRTNTNLIAPRDLLIDAFEERFKKYPNPEKSNRVIKLWSEIGKYEGRLGVKIHDTQKFYSYEPLIIFSHEEALGFDNLGKRKRLDPIRAIELPYFGRAEDMMKIYKKE